MMKYILLILLLVVTVTTLYLSIKLIVSARGSRLYNTVGFTGVVGVIPGIIYSITQFIDHDIFSFLMSTSVSVFVLLMYYLWRVAYNQINKNSYTYLIVGILSMSVVLSYLGYTQVIVLAEPLILVQKYQVLNILALVIVMIKFFEYRKMNNTMELNFIPIVLLVYLLSYMTSMLQTGDIISILTLIESSSIMLICYFYTLDYKRSFYY